MNVPDPERHGFVEPDEDTTENVVELLRRYDSELAANGVIDVEDTESYLLSSGASPDEIVIVEEEARQEQEKADIEAFTRLIRSTLNLIGLADPGSVTTDNVMSINEELYEQIDPYNLESLYFEVARKVHLRLGQYEPVTWRRMLEQAMPEGRPVVDLDNLQLKQRIEAFTYLINLGLDPNEISGMVKSSAEMGVAAPSKRQNVNRVAFFLEEEPLLDGLVSKLKKKSEKRKKIGKGAYTVERVVRMGQTILKLQRERLETKRRIQEKLPYGNEKKWDSIDYDVYRKMLGRIKVSLAISELIRAEMRIETIDDFLQEL